ncbi:unnamed protein product, partial [Cylicostephanus goldi]
MIPQILALLLVCTAIQAKPKPEDKPDGTPMPPPGGPKPLGGPMNSGPGGVPPIGSQNPGLPPMGSPPPGAPGAP